MTFQLRPAVRENVPLLIGLAGASGSGKTLSALLLAKGLSGGKKFAVIDTESGRAKAYADEFDFDTGDLVAPFRPSTYEKAIMAIDAMQKYSAIVVDSASHEYAGDGGILDWQEEILSEMVERSKKSGDTRPDYQIADSHKMRSWIEPKMAHKHFMTRLLQVRSHLILCYRAEPKTEIAKEKDDRGRDKTVIRPKQGLTGLDGWFPICEKNMPYELTAYFLLMADKPGVPMPIKLMEKHKPFFPTGKPITEEAGRKLAEWANCATAEQPKAYATAKEISWLRSEFAKRLHESQRDKSEQFLDEFLMTEGVKLTDEIPLPDFRELAKRAINQAKVIAALAQEKSA